MFETTAIQNIKFTDVAVYERSITFIWFIKKINHFVFDTKVMWFNIYYYCQVCLSPNIMSISFVEDIHQFCSI